MDVSEARCMVSKYGGNFVAGRCGLASGLRNQAWSRGFELVDRHAIAGLSGSGGDRTCCLCGSPASASLFSKEAFGAFGSWLLARCLGRSPCAAMRLIAAKDK